MPLRCQQGFFQLVMYWHEPKSCRNNTTTATVQSQLTMDNRDCAMYCTIDATYNRLHGIALLPNRGSPKAPKLAGKLTGSTSFNTPTMQVSGNFNCNVLSGWII